MEKHKGTAHERCGIVGTIGQTERNGIPHHGTGMFPVWLANEVKKIREKYLDRIDTVEKTYDSSLKYEISLELTDYFMEKLSTKELAALAGAYMIESAKLRVKLDSAEAYIQAMHKSRAFR